MDQTKAHAFAEQWAKDWNAHDVDALLAHFTDDVVFTSPVAIRVLGGDGVIRGKEELRRYWSEGIRLIPDLRFELLGVYAGISTVVINYRNQAGGVVNEVLTFDGDLVREGHGTYLAPSLLRLSQTPSREVARHGRSAGRRRGRRAGLSGSPGLPRLRRRDHRGPSPRVPAGVYAGGRCRGRRRIVACAPVG
jgi:hypothetical protein